MIKNNSLYNYTCFNNLDHDHLSSSSFKTMFELRWFQTLNQRTQQCLTGCRLPLVIAKGSPVATAESISIQVYIMKPTFRIQKLVNCSSPFNQELWSMKHDSSGTMFMHFPSSYQSYCHRHWGLILFKFSAPSIRSNQTRTRFWSVQVDCFFFLEFNVYEKINCILSKLMANSLQPLKLELFMRSQESKSCSGA